MHYELCITKEMATRLMHKVRSDLEPYYDMDSCDKREHNELAHYAEQSNNLEQERKNSNKKIVDYLEAIDSEITKILQNKLIADNAFVILKFL